MVPVGTLQDLLPQSSWKLFRRYLMPIVRICMKLICRPSLSWRTNSLSVHFHLREFYLDPFLAAPLLMSEPFLMEFLKSIVI